MLELLKKLFFFLKLTGLFKAALLSILILLGMLLELLSIALIIPILSYMVNKDLLEGYYYFTQTKIFIKEHFNLNIFNFLMILLIIVYVLKNIFLFTIAFFKYTILNNIQVTLSEKLFTFYMNVKYSYHLNKNSAYFIRNLTSEIPNLKAAILQTINCYTEILIITFLSFLLIYTNSLTGLLTILILISAFLFLILIFKKILQLLGKIRLEHAGLATKQIMEGLGGIKDVKILFKENYFISSYRFFMKKFNHSDKVMLTYSEIPRYFIEIVGVITVVSIIVTMSFLNYPLDHIVVTIGVFTICLFRMMPSINRLVVSFNTLSYLKESVSKIYEIFILEKNFQITNEKFSGYNFHNKIVLNNINFQYGNNKKIFQSLNLEINKNDTIGIFGKSGEGKSTLINIIIGFAKPNEGEIILDSKKIDVTKEVYLTNLGHVPQHIYLSDTSIKENIAFGINKDEINLDHLNKCIQLAKLIDFINDLPDGLDTIIGENGIRISGGQRQRIGIARALYNRPKILIFDEATNSLDSETEKEIMKDIYKLKNDFTIIIVSHNLETLNECYKIFELKNKTINKINKIK